MRSNRIRRVIFLLAIVAAPVCAQAAANTFVEDFTNTIYRDAAGTTANWNTSAGRLELANHVINQVATYPVLLPTDLKLDGPWLFILTSVSQLHRFDVSDPGNPVDDITLPGLTDPKGLDVDGSYIYIADGNGGLRIHRRQNFLLHGSLGTPGTAQHVAVVGHVAYVASGTSGLVVVDLANPAAPVQIGIVNTPGTAFRVDVEGNYCYVADAGGGLQVIDVSDPAAPGLAASLTVGSYVSDLMVDGDLAYLADFSNGLVVVDVADPTAPAVLADLPGVQGMSVVVAGNTAYLGRPGDILEVDISNPAAPTPFNILLTPGGFSTFMATDGEHLYASDSGNDLLRVMEVLEPSPVTEVASLDLNLLEFVDLQGNILYGTGLDFYAIDVTDPTSPNLLDTLIMPTRAFDFDVEGNYAYVAAFEGGMYVIDVSDPAALAIVGHLPSSSGGNLHYAAAVDGDLCLLGGSTAGNQLQVVDVSDPTTPVELSVSGLSGQPDDIAIAGKYAYITVGSAGLDIVDISNPLAPAVVANQPVTVESYSVLVEGEFAYMTSRDEGIYILNVLNPASPYMINNIATPSGFISGLARSGRYLFTSVDGEGLLMYDVSNPYAPKVPAHNVGNNANFPRRLVASGRYVYQATRFDGLDVLQVMARDFELDENIGQSLAIDSGGQNVFAAKLVSQRAADASWSLSANNGVSWLPYTEGTWKTLATPGPNLRWRVNLGQNLAGVRPTLDQIDIQMAFAFPVITDIQDIANDQGRQVRLTWQYSGHDAPGSSTPIYNYAVYRQIDPGLGAVALGAEPSDATFAPALAGWDYIAMVPATVDDEYSVVVPTLADSTVAAGDYQSRFFVRALTASPATYFDSPPDSGFSVDNLAPAAPGNFLLAGDTLSWDEAAAADFDYFTVYGSAEATFDETAVALGLLTGTTFAVTAQPHAYFHVTATDFSGNEGQAASTGALSGVGAVPARFALHANVPNPFNPMTSIRFELPAPGSVSLLVYGVDGRLVRRLVAGELLAAGAQERRWDGTDDAGRRVSAGVYFYQLVADGFSQTQSMTMVK